MPYRATDDETVFDSLQAMFAGRSRKDLRRLLRDGKVSVNGQVVSLPESPVRRGEAVECNRVGRPMNIHPRVRILHEDDQIIVVEKGTGILTSGGTRGREPTVVDVIEAYLRRRGVRRSIHACHRLDRDVSGVLMLAKESRISKAVRDDPKRHLRERVYHAMVEGKPAEATGTIRGFLRDDEDQVVRAASGPEEGKLAITHYKTLRTSGAYSLLEVRLETGRKNQIRVHLSQIGHPVAGDAKYGARTDPRGRVCLHAVKLALFHPLTGESLTLESRAPDFLGKLR